MSKKEPEPGQGDADLAAQLEAKADEINAETQPDWEALADIEADARTWASSSERARDPHDRKRLLERAEEASAGREDLVAEIAAILEA